eukprot:SAG22_NODE_399_length_11094_cov_5.593452_4_plen_198_part_00
MTSGLQIIAPILLLAGIIEDQFSAMFMMLMNLLASAIGIIKDATGAVMPVIGIGKTMVMMLLQGVIVVLVILRFLKKKIKKVRVAPPPPVWTLVKMPPPIVDLMAIVLSPALLNLLNTIVLQINPVIGGYLKTFAQLAAAWMKEEGPDVLDEQFQVSMGDTMLSFADPPSPFRSNTAEQIREGCSKLTVSPVPGSRP